MPASIQKFPVRRNSTLTFPVVSALVSPFAILLLLHYQSAEASRTALANPPSLRQLKIGAQRAEEAQQLDTRFEGLEAARTKVHLGAKPLGDVKSDRLGK